MRAIRFGTQTEAFACASFKPQAAGRERIDIGRVDEAAVGIGALHVADSEVVGEDEDNVRLLRALECPPKTIAVAKERNLVNLVTSWNTEPSLHSPKFERQNLSR